MGIEVSSITKQCSMKFIGVKLQLAEKTIPLKVQISNEKGRLEY